MPGSILQGHRPEIPGLPSRVGKQRRGREKDREGERTGKELEENWNFV